MGSQIGKRGIIILSILVLLATKNEVVAQQTPADTQDPYGRYARVTPSMAIIIVVLITAFFFMGFFSIYFRHCSGSSGEGSVLPLGMAGARGRAAAATRGLDPAVIETFPTLVYSVVKGLKIGKGALECAVCLNEFEDDETLRLIPKCDHVFHPECIDAWLESHTTCPVCRTDLTLQPGETTPKLTELHPELADLEAQNGGGSQGDDGHDHEHEGKPLNLGGEPPEQEVMNGNKTLKRSLTRGSRSGRRPPKFPRSHSTGHSLVQPGENTERFTLRLPAEVRKQIMNQELNRTLSMVMLPRGGSSRRGYRMGGEGSSRGKMFNYKRIERPDQEAKSDRSIFNRTPSFLQRASSFLTRATSIKSPRTVSKDNEGGSSTRSVKPEVGEPSRLPV